MYFVSFIDCSTGTIRQPLAVTARRGCLIISLIAHCRQSIPCSAAMRFWAETAYLTLIFTFAFLPLAAVTVMVVLPFARAVTLPF